MKTHEEQQAFFDEQRPALRHAAERGGAAEVVSYVAGRPDAQERRILFFRAREALDDPEWPGRDYDLLVAVGRAGLEEFARQAALPAEDRRRLTDLAGALAYNLAADLADCWPGPRPSLRRAHFQAGREAAEEAIRCWTEVAKEPGPLSAAWWAKGMHQLSLGDVPSSLASFERSLLLAREAAPDDESAFGVVLGTGYAGLARWILGSTDGLAEYRTAMRAFACQLFDPARKADARVGIDQLETVRERYAPDRKGSPGAEGA